MTDHLTLEQENRIVAAYEARQQADRIVAAYDTAQGALIELINLLDTVTREAPRDDAIAVAHDIAYAHGSSGGVFSDRHGNRTLARAADIRERINDLVNLSYEVPSYFEKEHTA